MKFTLNFFPNIRSISIYLEENVSKINPNINVINYDFYNNRWLKTNKNSIIDINKYPKILELRKRYKDKIILNQYLIALIKIFEAGYEVIKIRSDKIIEYSDLILKLLNNISFNIPNVRFIKEDDFIKYIKELTNTRSLYSITKKRTEEISKLLLDIIYDNIGYRIEEFRINDDEEIEREFKIIRESTDFDDETIYRSIKMSLLDLFVKSLNFKFNEVKKFIKMKKRNLCYYYQKERGVDEDLFHINNQIVVKLILLSGYRGEMFNINPINIPLSINDLNKMCCITPEIDNIYFFI